ncbi:MAG TPA: ankyrin repeat domain-containing protein [Bryobacteraceae bacterium]
MTKLYGLIAATALLCSAPVQGQTAVTKAQSVSDRFYQAIRNDDLAALKELAANGDINARDQRGATPLMYAAAFGNAGQVKLLLDAGADVNARNTFNASALIWAGGDAVKSVMLIEHGADVNVRTQQGRTPLMVAAKRQGNLDLLRLLLAKGADPHIPGDTTLLAAAQSGDLEIMRLLIEKGSSVNAIGARAGETPLHHAAASGSIEAARLLLTKGANVNAALRTVTAVRGGSSLEMGVGKQTALMWAAPSGSPEMIRVLLEAGANVNSQDIRGMSPLMLAVASETQDREVVKLFLRAGADVNAHSMRGETALDWAKKFGSRPVVSVLQDAGAREGVSYRPPPAPEPNATRDPARAVQQSIALLERSSAEFFKQSGCVSCHHQDMTAFAVRAARSAGIAVDETAARERLNVMRSMLGTAQELELQGVVEATNIQASHLRGLWAAGYPPGIITDSAVASLVSAQRSDGHWPRSNGFVRSPTSEGPIGSTAEAILALQAYTIPARQIEFRERITRASVWLLKAKPRSTDEHAMLLLAVSAAGVQKEKVRAIADSLLTQQRADGGWAGNPNLGSDAHSTGKVLYALRETGFISASDPVHRRGVQYLLNTQYPDGSWYVRSRAVGFQPYFQSAFPFEHDQWISAAGTAWAAETIARSIELSRATSAAR